MTTATKPTAGTTKPTLSTQFRELTIARNQLIKDAANTPCARSRADRGRQIDRMNTRIEAMWREMNAE